MKTAIYCLISILLLFFISINSFSQYLNVDFGVTGYAFPNEPAIMINPKNTNQIVVGTNYFYITGTDTALSSYYYSTNGGANWQGGPLFSPKARTAGDPVIIVDTNGAFYFITLTNWGRSDWLDNLLCLKSTNGGINWNNGKLFGFNNAKDMDKPWACVDFTHGIYGNNIYVTWTEFDKYGSRLAADSTHIMFAKSSDNGNTFSPSKRINAQSGNCYDSTNTVEGAVPCVGINGEIFVVWAGWTNLYFNKSTDGGNNWLTSERVIAQQIGGWKGVGSGKADYNGFPISCCDNSNGLYRGNIYVNWVDQRSGLSDQDVWLTKSTNGGDNWSVPVRVNTDTSHRNQFLTWMTLDQKTGFLYCVFYDRRNSPTVLTDVYVARSTDGGNSFVNIKANTTSINMLNSTVGDYINISAYNNKVRPVWINSANYSNRIFTAIIDTFYTIGINRIREEIPSSFSLYQNYPNPFNPISKIKFDIPNYGFPIRALGNDRVVVLKVYDILGKEIQTLLNEQLQPGTYEVTFDGSYLPSGVYFYKLTAGNYAETKKMLLIK